jgi:hypothetical protein
MEMTTVASATMVTTEVMETVEMIQISQIKIPRMATESKFAVKSAK